MQALANPYMLVPVVISGVPILIVMLCKNGDNSNLEEGKYYCVLVLPDEKEVLFMSIPGAEMSIGKNRIPSAEYYRHYHLYAELLHNV